MSTHVTPILGTLLWACHLKAKAHILRRAYEVLSDLTPHSSLALAPNLSALSCLATAIHWFPCSFLNIPSSLPPQPALALSSA